MALKLLGVTETDPDGAGFLLERGGISRTRIFTKLHLALIGVTAGVVFPTALGDVASNIYIQYL